MTDGPVRDGSVDGSARDGSARDGPARDAAFAGPVFGSGNRPALIGHRGLGKGTVAGHGENTLGSFLACAEHRLDWVEVDVRRTADDVLFVMHDPAYTDWTVLAQIDARAAAARGTLALADLLAALPPGLGIDFDLKSCLEDATRPRHATTAGFLAPIAAEVARTRPTLVTSFDPAALAVLAELAPGVPRGLLTWLNFPAGQAVAAAAHLDVAVLALHSGSLGAGFGSSPGLRRRLCSLVDGLHAAGREFLVWCPTRAQSRVLADAGADALCVNDGPSWAAGLPAPPAPGSPGAATAEPADRP